MAAATNQVASFGRLAVHGSVAIVKVTITATATTYATASGGLPIDLAGVLQIAAAPSQPYLNPSDIVDVYPVGLSTNGYLPGGFALGSPITYAAAGYPFAGGSTSNIHPDQQIATCPATIRLYGIGASAANHAGFGEVADGSVTDTITLHLVIARGGTNVN